MEPGHEDREYGLGEAAPRGAVQASMEPGHEDREYLTNDDVFAFVAVGLNGARS